MEGGVLMIEELEWIELRYKDYVLELVQARENNVPEDLVEPLQNKIEEMESMISEFSEKFLERFPPI